MHTEPALPYRYSIWLAGITFLIYQFFLQLSSGVLLTSLSKEIELTSLATGILASAFYYIYTAMQMPVGMLFDRFNARFLLTFNALLAAIGCIIFSLGHDFFTLFAGRFLMGAGSSFAFIGLSQLLCLYFPLRQFSFMIGLSETLGFSITVSAILGMGFLIQYYGWRDFIHCMGFAGVFISLLCLRFIPNNIPQRTSATPFLQQVKNIVTNRVAWINGLFVGLVFSVVTVFGALWAVPFIQLKVACSLFEATLICGLLLFGAGISCPLYGKLAIHMNHRKPLMHFSCLSTTILFIIILFVPFQSSIVLALCMLLMGLLCGAYLLSYTIALEITEPESRSTSTGFTNTLAMLTAPVLQPLIGFILDLKTSNGTPGLQDFQSALLVIPVILILANVLIRWLPEKPREETIHTIAVLKNRIQEKSS